MTSETLRGVTINAKGRPIMSVRALTFVVWSPREGRCLALSPPFPPKAERWPLIWVDSMNLDLVIAPEPAKASGGPAQKRLRDQRLKRL